MSDEIQKAKELSVLMPPPPTEGGLIRMPKKNPTVDADHQFKVPSLIGNIIRLLLFTFLLDWLFF